MTPVLNSYGIFTATAPFVIPAVNYRCSSLQLISTLVNNGVDVFNLYYAPNAIDNSVYLADLNSGVAIVTLVSNEADTINIPGSYILVVPAELAVPYSRLIISLDLGPLPDALDVSQILTDIQPIANAYVGVISTPVLHKIPVKNNVSYAEHKIKEAVRALAVNKAISFYTAKMKAEAELAEAREKIALLEEAIIALS